MLQGFSTQNGTVITIYGGYNDLPTLYWTIIKISESPSLVTDDPHSVALMAFAHDIRKAYSEQRLKEELTFDGNRKTNTWDFSTYGPIY